MAHDSDATHSIWTSESVPDYPALTGDVRTGVCIIGAGIAGLTTAYLLTRAGQAVTVIDDGPIGGGETSRTTAHLTIALDDRYHALVSRFGEADARRIAESHSAAIEQIETIAAAEDINCDFERVDGYLTLAKGADRDELDRELEATRSIGLTNITIVPRLPLNTFESGPALRFPRQAQFHPLKYLHGVAAAIVRDGGVIACGTKATNVEDGELAKVTTANGYTILADSVVVATNSPVNDWMVMHTKLAPYRSYVVGLAVPADAIAPMLIWDTADPYHYVRLHPAEPGAAHDTLIVGGEDHKTGQADDTGERFGRLERWARDRFPNAGDVIARWSGQLLEPVDGIAYLGRNPGNEQRIYIITGTSGNGLTYGTIGAMLVSDLIQGRENPWTELYDPSRITFKSVGEYARENLNVAEQYAAWLTPGDVGSVDEIPNGSGAVIRRGMHKVAVYKDENGAITERSAVCTHLYCIVDWNDTEKSWDCPCHGSRFDCHGTVITGPAIADLEPLPSDSRPA